MRSSDRPQLRLVDNRASAEAEAVEWIENLLKLHSELTYDPFNAPEVREDGSVYPGIVCQVLTEREWEELYAAVMCVWRSWPFPTFQAGVESFWEKRKSLAGLIATFSRMSDRLRQAERMCDDAEERSILLFYSSVCLLLSTQLELVGMRIQRRPPSGVFRRSDLLLRISVEQDDE